MRPKPGSPPGNGGHGTASASPLPKEYFWALLKFRGEWYFQRKIYFEK